MPEVLSKDHQAEECGQRGRGRPRDTEARSRILESALEVLEELGFASTTTDAIAERAGASKATIYRWWPNKAAVLIEALRERVAQERPFPDTGDLRNDLRVQLENFIQLLTGRHGRIFKGFIAAAQGDPEFAESFRSVWIAPRRAEVRKILEGHKNRGTLRADVDTRTLLDLLYGPLYFRLMAGHERLETSLAGELTDLALRGVL